MKESDDDVSEEMGMKKMKDEDMYEEGSIEEIDLDELLAELEAAEEAVEGKDKMKDETVEETPVSEEAPVAEEETVSEEAPVEEEAGAEDEVGEITVDELKDIIKDVMQDVLGGEGGEDMEVDVDGDGDMDVAIDGDGDGDIEIDEEKVDETKAELNEAINVIKTLKSELNEVNLLNAKLLYVNKLFRSKTLTENQKVKVINAFDRAESVKEVKNIFETIKDAVTTETKKTVNESRSFASKPTGNAPKKPIVESNDFVSRMQKLAGII